MSQAEDFRALVAQHGSPLLLVDCEVVRRQYRSLSAALPGVELFYALKPLPHAAVVAELRDLGASFDVATSGEIRLVRAAGIPPERCIHTHPIKSDAEIRSALERLVTEHALVRLQVLEDKSREEPLNAAEKAELQGLLRTKGQSGRSAAPK